MYNWSKETQVAQKTLGFQLDHIVLTCVCFTIAALTLSGFIQKITPLTFVMVHVLLFAGPHTLLTHAVVQYDPLRKDIFNRSILGNHFLRYGFIFLLFVVSLGSLNFFNNSQFTNLSHFFVFKIFYFVILPRHMILQTYGVLKYEMKPMRDTWTSLKVGFQALWLLTSLHFVLGSWPSLLIFLDTHSAVFFLKIVTASVIVFLILKLSLTFQGFSLPHLLASSRLLIWIPALYSSTGLLLTTGFHGLESVLFTYRNYQKNLPKGNGLEKKYLIAGGLYLLIGAGLALFRRQKSQELWNLDPASPAIVLLTSVSLTFAIYHAFIESFLYKNDSQKKVIERMGPEAA
jgi:hypothetical protein